MRYYLLDEISSEDMKKITGIMEKHATKSSFDELFWVHLPDDILTEVQYEHNDCKPFAFALELGPDNVKIELFIRSMKGMSCNCQAYCTQQQREFIFNFTKNIIESLGIKT